MPSSVAGVVVGPAALATHRALVAQTHLHTESHTTVEEQLTKLVLDRTGRNVLGNSNIIGLKVVGNQREGFDIIGFIPQEYRQPYYLKSLSLETVKQFRSGIALSIDELKVLPLKEIETESGLDLKNYFPKLGEQG